MDRLTRQVAIAQLLTMSSGEVRARAAALRETPPAPKEWADTAAQVLEEQAVLAGRLSTLRMEFDDPQWQRLGVLLREGLEAEDAADTVRAG
jgi:hypothetical protein